MRRQGAAAAASASGGWSSSSLPTRPQPATRRAIRTGGGTNQRGRGAKAAEVEARYSEMEQQLKNLQLPAACSFLLGLAERYVRTSSSREMSASTSLPNKKTTLALIDTFILRIPSPARGKVGQRSTHRTEQEKKTFTPFEEVELLDALRVQIEERQGVRDIQLILFDAIFGLGSEEKVYSDQRTSILQKLVSLAISVGSLSILACAAFWMELHPQPAKDLAAVLYYDFCELLPQAMDPLLQLASLCPPLAKQLVIALTAYYPLHTVQDQSGGAMSQSTTSKLCPPIRLLQLVTHWISTSPEFITSPSMLMEVKEKGLVLLHSPLPQSSTEPSPLKGLAQWCIVEPLLPRSLLLTVKGSRNISTGKADTASNDSRPHEFPSLISRLHADLLTSLTVLPKGSVRSLVSTDELVVLVASLLDFGQQVQSLPQPLSSEEHKMGMEVAIDRLAQLLQIGLSTGAIILKPEELASIASTLPKNRLLSLVLSHHQNAPLKS